MSESHLSEHWSKKYTEINKMAPNHWNVLSRSQATFLSRSLAKGWRSQRYRRWVPRPSGRRSPLCRCRSCRGWGTQRYRWHKGTWVVCRWQFRRTLHRSGPRSQCRRRTPSSLWCTCLWRAEPSRFCFNEHREKNRFAASLLPNVTFNFDIVKCKYLQFAKESVLMHLNRG